MTSKFAAKGSCKGETDSKSILILIPLVYCNKNYSALDFSLSMILILFGCF